MSDETALLCAVHSHPDEDIPRLVYADWLQENGQPERAEFIRVQIALANPDAHSPDEVRRLSDREQELLGAHRENWAANLLPFNDGTMAINFLRGFPEIVEADGTGPADLEVLGHLPGLRLLMLSRCVLSPDVLRHIAGLSQLDAFSAEYTQFDPSWLELLDSLPCWTYIRLDNADIDEEAWQACQDRRMSRVAQLAPGPQRLAAVRHLRAIEWYGMRQRGDPDWHGTSVRPGRPVKQAWLNRSDTTDSTLMLLGFLPELEEIHILHALVTAAGLQHLSGLPNLRTIGLNDTRCDSIVPLTTCATLEHLMYCDHDVMFEDSGTVGLERLTNLRHLTLHVRDTRVSWLGDATLRRIGALRELRKLSLSLGPLDDRKKSLAPLLNLTKLESLTLYHTADPGDPNEISGGGDLYTGDNLRRFLESLR